MSGLSTLVNAAAGGYDGYRDQQYTQNAQDALQAQRADEALRMAAAQQTYQPQAQAQIAASGLAAATNNANATQVPARLVLSNTQLGTAQGAATAAAARQPTIDQTADTVTGTGLSAADAAQARQPAVNAAAQSQADTTASASANQFANQPAVNQAATNAANVAASASGQAVANQPVLNKTSGGATIEANNTQNLANVVGLTTAMMQGGDAVRSYLQQHTDNDDYPGLKGQTIGKSGIDPTGKNFIIQNAAGEQISSIPVANLQQARSMSIPSKFTVAAPGSSIVKEQGGAATIAATAPVPDAFTNRFAPANVQMMKYLKSQMPSKSPDELYQMAKSASNMSRPTFVANFVKNYAMPGGEAKAGDLAKQGGEIYDQIQRASAPGLSGATAPSSGNPQIDSMISGAPVSDNAVTPEVAQ